MAQMTNSPVTVGGVEVTGDGAIGEVQAGVAPTRGGDRRADPVEAALHLRGADDDGRSGLRVAAEITIDAAPASRGQRQRGSEAAAATVFPTVQVLGPERAAGELGHIAVVEQDGFVTFVLPRSLDEERSRFEIPLGGGVGAPDTRGLATVLGRMTVRVLGVFGKPLAEAAVRTLSRGVEGRLRQHRLRPFEPTTFSKAGTDQSVLPSAGGTGLLLIHGTNSSSHQTFRFERDFVAELGTRYGGRVVAFDHPSIAWSPKENAEELAPMLQGLGYDRLDVLAHARGGLVARELLALRPDGVTIGSVVFVATPNNGTPLAAPAHLDKMLSTATNAMSLIPDNPVTDTIAIALDVLREWVLQPAMALPGIDPLQPGSDVLRRLATSGHDGVRFRAMSSSYEPRAHGRLPTRIRDALMDTVFEGSDNDLVVPTRSPYAENDRFHVPAEDRLVLDTSFGVAHNGFWRERVVLDQLKEWLAPERPLDDAKPPKPEYRDLGAEFEDGLRSDGRVGLITQATAALGPEAADAAKAVLGASLPPPTRVQRVARTAGVVVVLPGIMGSRLSVGTQEIWLRPWNIIRGRFSRLAVDPSVQGSGDVSVTGLLAQYAPLVARISESWDVVPFPYDWRRPILETAERLAEVLEQGGHRLSSTDAPVHFVAHSMGGLVARALLTERIDEWRKGSGRLIQLGTPNHGSFAMPLVARGEELILRALVLADAANARDEVLRTIRSFPGLFELFPSPARPLPDGDLAHERFYDPAFWADGDHGALDELLTAARAFHERMASAPELGPGRHVYIAGDGHRTPYRARLEAGGGLSIGITTRGDGRVAHNFGFEDLGIDEVFFVPSNHGDLIGDDLVLSSIDELLRHGTPAGLPTVPHTSRSAEADTTVWVSAKDVEAVVGLVAAPTRGVRGEIDPERALLDASAVYVGRTGQRATVVPPLRVSVVHGSLEQATHPVAAGRYRGIPVQGALGFIDRRLGGALRDLDDAKLAPQEAGNGRYVPAPAGTYPRGAILLGLGDFGSLTPDLLTRAMQTGVTDYALAVRREAGGVPVVGVASVLAGTPGRYGLSVVDSIEATIRGVARASVDLIGKAVIDELEIIELFEGGANDASFALERLQSSFSFVDLDVDVVIDPVVQIRPGGRPGSHRQDESGAAWPRVMLELAPAERRAARTRSGRLRKLRYVAVGRGSMASHLEVLVDTDEIRRHVRQALESLDDEQAKNTLFELLFPNDAKLDLDTFDNLHLLVDEQTAWIPWELLAGRGAGGEMNQALALRAGLLRQLKPTIAGARRTTLPAVTNTALVIGDPPSGQVDFGRLVGARQEATEVAAQLDGNFEVTKLIFGEEDDPNAAMAIGNAFFARHYRVVHVAAHGMLDPDTGEGGIVIGGGQLLTSRHFRQRLVAPDLVFLNCCHVGLIEASETERARRGSFADVAASLALELMNSGVKAVVAAGWAVDDRAAREFATAFYDRMLAGDSFGESVRLARRAARHVGRSNTWGAYQCYGDPDFRFATTRRIAAAAAPIRSLSLLHGRLVELAQLASDSNEHEHTRAVLAALRQLEQDEVPRFGDRADVWQALAEAYAEAGAFGDAVHAYRRAVEHKTDAGASLKAVQQLANLEARLAAHRVRSGHAADAPAPPSTDGPRKVHESPKELFERAEVRLDRLMALNPTAECHALKGSLYKKWASVTPAGPSQDQRKVKARDAYVAACTLAADEPELDVYHGCMSLLMQYAIEGAPATEPFATYLARLVDQRARYDTDAGDYFVRAKIADIRAVEIVVGGMLSDEAQQRSIVEEFTEAFAVRSSARQRLSVIDNYLDLSSLLRSPDDRVAAGRVANRLGDFPRTRK